MLPYGLVANDEAAVPSSQLDTAVTVGADGILRTIEVSWGTWRYTVGYDDLGAAPALKAPAGAISLSRFRDAWREEKGP